MSAPPDDRAEGLWYQPQTITLAQLHTLLAVLSDRITAVVTTHLEPDQATVLLLALAAEVRELLARATHPTP